MGSLIAPLFLASLIVLLPTMFTKSPALEINDADVKRVGIAGSFRVNNR